jgi:hypothetical protein
MRYDICSLLRFIFKKNILNFAESQQGALKTIYININKYRLKDIIALISLGSLFISTFFCDLTGLERGLAQKQAVIAINVVCCMFLSRWGIKLVLCSISLNWEHLINYGKFISGAI